jgi:hypothetical protein
MGDPQMLLYLAVGGWCISLLLIGALFWFNSKLDSRDQKIHNFQQKIQKLEQEIVYLENQLTSPTTRKPLSSGSMFIPPRKLEGTVHHDPGPPDPFTHVERPVESVRRPVHSEKPDEIYRHHAPRIDDPYELADSAYRTDGDGFAPIQVDSSTRLYAQAPEREGYFMAAQLSTEASRLSLYLFLLSNGSKHASVSIITDSQRVSAALNSPDQYLAPVCSYDQNPSHSFTRVINVQNGKFVLHEGKWKVHERIKIRFE